MTVSPDVLWWVNSEYRKRLSRAENYIALLEQLVLTRATSDEGQLDGLLQTLEEARQYLELLLQDHRNWRHTYYYQPEGRKRMVQSDADIARALARFEQMRARHEQGLHMIADVLAQYPRPNPDLTYLPLGDLWLMTQYAIRALMQFTDQPDRLPPA